MVRQGPASEVTYTGTVNDINLMLARGELNYESVADFVGSDTLTITPKTSATRNAATTSLTINVDQLNTSVAPLTVYTPNALSVPPGMQLLIAGLGIDDPNATVGTMTATFTVTHGTLSINPCEPDGITASQLSYNTGHSVATVTGSLNAINATLSANDGLIYRSTSGYHGWASLTIAVADQTTPSITGGAEVAIAVNHPPMANPDPGYTVAAGQR